MVTIEHNLKFVTELDETHETSKQLLALPKEMQIAMLEGMLRDLMAPIIQPAIDHINEGNSFATLKVVR